MTQFQGRNPKSEARNPKQTPNPKPQIRNQNRPVFAAAFVWDFEFRCFGFVSDFGFRASDLGAKKGSPSLLQMGSTALAGPAARTWVGVPKRDKPRLGSPLRPRPRSLSLCCFGQQKQGPGLAWRGPSGPKHRPALRVALLSCPVLRMPKWIV